MANSLKKKNAPSKPESTKETTETITFNQSVSKETFNALSKVKKAKGFLTEQEVVRLAIAFFLEKNN